MRAPVAARAWLLRGRDGPLRALPPILLGLCAVLLACRLPSASVPAAAGASPEFATNVAALQTTRADDARAHALVASLTSQVGPRLPGSAGDAAAVKWALRAMTQLGFDSVHAEPVNVPGWERGDAQAAIVSPLPQPLVLTALGSSVPTPNGGIEAHVIEVEGLRALATLDDSAVKGRIVFFNKRTVPTRDGSGYGRAVGVRSRGPSAAAKKGAVAVLIRSIGTGAHRMPHTGNTWYKDDAPKIPAAALAHADADVLSAQLATARQAQSAVTVRLTLTTRVGTGAVSANVVGELRGREKSEEIVLLAAHLDSWDLGHGAIDDAAGCAIVLHALGRIAALPRRPRRTIRVVLFAAEEIGIFGAKAYAKAHATELSNHVLAVEADFGGGPVYAVSSRVSESARAAMTTLASLLAPLGIRDAGNTAEGGADLNPMNEAGVPVMDLHQEGLGYFDVHHSAGDTLDKVDAKEIAQAARAFATLAYAAAELPMDFGRAPPRGPKK